MTRRAAGAPHMQPAAVQRLAAQQAAALAGCSRAQGSLRGAVAACVHQLLSRPQTRQCLSLGILVAQRLDAAPVI